MRLRLLALLVLVLILPILPARQVQAAEPQMRAFWVDAFHPGIKTPAQTDLLIADAQRSGANTLIVQVRRRADSYYRDSLEPIATDVAANYDPLADLIAKAHGRGLAVHGWAVALPAWRSEYNQPDRSHVWYQHGPTTPAGQNWFMLRDDGVAGDCGTEGCGYFLDPGHPAVADYTVNVLLHLIRRYDLDGLHLDYIRYPSARFGYNPVSLQRFQQATGRGDRPDPADPQWMQWRRDQVTKLVKRIYLNMLAHKPAMQLSVAAIAWGGGPPNGDFKGTAAYSRVLQDWNGWLQAGYIDWALPMVYDQYSNPQQRDWYNQWVDWTKANQGRRAAGIGVGAWLNDPDGNMAQLRRAMDDRVLLGASLYSYAIPVAGDRNAFLDRLRRELWSDPAPAPVPAWKTRPQKGFVLGRVEVGGAAVPNASVHFIGPDGTDRWGAADGSGVFGDVDLAPGRWTIAARHPQTKVEHSQSVEVVAGRVTHVTLAAGGASAPPADISMTPAAADRAFAELWNRTDLTVARGEVNRSWLWGPASFTTGSETYRESPGGRRVVQYWDKSRMEVSNPGADRSQLWFVTNGLLTKELISGRVQIGENEFVNVEPSGAPVVGDYAGEFQRHAYASFAGVASLNGDRRAPQRTGVVVDQVIDEQGKVGTDTSFSRYNVRNATYNGELGHNIPNVFQGFLDNMPLPWVFVMGYPITEPYWTRASVGGKANDVLVQLYERRTLTYTPSNPAAFQVEMGNVGQHYYRWRYHEAPWER